MTVEDIDSAMFQLIEEENIPDWLFSANCDDIVFPYTIAEINGAFRLAEILKMKLEEKEGIV